MRTGGWLALYPAEITDVEMKSAVAAKKNSHAARMHRDQYCEFEGIDYWELWVDNVSRSRAMFDNRGIISRSDQRMQGR